MMAQNEGNLKGHLLIEGRKLSRGPGGSEQVNGLVCILGLHQINRELFGNEIAIFRLGFLPAVTDRSVAFKYGLRVCSVEFPDFPGLYNKSHSPWHTKMSLIILYKSLVLIELEVLVIEIVKLVKDFPMFFVCLSCVLFGYMVPIINFKKQANIM